MKIVEVNNSNIEAVNLINNSSGRDNLKSFLENDFVVDKNTIFSCILGVENNEINNFCVYTGQKDTKFVQLNIEDLSNSKFLEESVNYAFNNLDCYTIAIFSEKQSKVLEDYGFENLGNDNGMITYIKDKDIEKEVGRVRI